MVMSRQTLPLHPLPKQPPTRPAYPKGLSCRNAHRRSSRRDDWTYWIEPAFVFGIAFLSLINNPGQLVDWIGDLRRGPLHEMQIVPLPPAAQRPSQWHAGRKSARHRPGRKRAGTLDTDVGLKPLLACAVYDTTQHPWPRIRVRPVQPNKASSTDERLPDLRATVPATTLQSLARESLLASLARRQASA